MSGLLVVLVIILVALAGYLVNRQNQIQQRLDEQQRVSAAATAALEEAKRPKFEHRTDVLTAGTITVIPSQPQAIKISADTTTMRDIKITGRFSASGGTDNGIETFVFDEDNYTNWLNNHEAQPIFNSGVKTVGDVQATIGKSGVYYVVFSDRRNFMARKVDADLKLDYDKRVN